MLNPQELGKLARALDMTREEEIGCDECFEELDRFVESELAGLDAAAAMPLVQDHLDRCGDCREEFEALLEALKTTERTPGVGSPLRRLWRRARRAFGSSRGIPLDATDSEREELE
ncbi:MAG: hypothetical protein M3Q49_06995 [Actinomycetota bacterium]|nr:hypothetical protein [Actinomycetota bacterium]